MPKTKNVIKRLQLIDKYLRTGKFSYKELKDNFIYSMFNTNDRDAEFAAFKSKVDNLLGK